MPVVFIAFVGIAALAAYFLTRDKPQRKLTAREERELAQLDPTMRAKALAVMARMEAAGHLVTVADKGGRRTLAEQAALYAAGASQAKGSDGPHTAGCAVDFAFLTGGKYTVPEKSDPRWTKLGEAIEGLGMSWGGRWSFADKPHAELRDWKSRRRAFA